MMQPGILSGRVALITGASSGIGQATAWALSEAGATIGIHFHRNQEGAAQTLSKILERGGTGFLLQGDLSNSDDAQRIVDVLAEKTGRIDILFNNAGSPLERSPLDTCSLELWNQVLATNLTSAFLVTQRAIPHLKKSGSGAIVNNLSLAVQTGGANGAGAYAVAKGGLQVMTRTLARELAPLVRTNAIMPGVIETPHHAQFTTTERMQQYSRETPLGRNGVAEEVAGTVLFLVSDAAKFINGAMIDINGGRFLR